MSGRSITLMMVLVSCSWVGDVMAEGLFENPLTRPRLVGLTPLALAQSDEPAPPGGAQPSEEPAAQPSEEPGGSPGEEPGARPGEEPGAKPGEEPSSPTAAPAEPSSPPAGEPPAPEASDTTEVASEVSYGGGLQFRGIFVPTWFLNAFLDASTPLNSVSFGGEFIRRKGNFDLVASINFGFYSPRDGNYLGNGKNPGIDTDYIDFRNLNLLAFEVGFFWHHDFTPWVSLMYGAGLGFGVVLGEIYRISNYSGNCTHDNLEDFNTCNPVQPGDASFGEWQNSRDQWLKNHTGTGADTPQDPHLYKEEGVWPVVPIVHLLLGVNFKITEQFSVRVDGGWHDAFYIGTGGHYFF